MDEGRLIAEGKPDELKSGLSSVVNVKLGIKNKEILALLESFSQDGKVLESEDSYRVYCEDAEEAAPKLLKSLGQMGYEASRVGIERPSLEDVFFKLTRKSVRDS